MVEEEVVRDLHEVEHGEDWKEEEWEDWRKFKKWKQTGRAKSHQEDSGEDLSSGEDLPWDELEVEDVQVLPDEVLGWLLLRRANLSSSSRLSVQASVQNSLSFRAIERALRDQEEELLHVDAHRPPQQQRRRTYWVEEEGAWGLLMTPDDAMEELSGEAHWVGDRLPVTTRSTGPGMIPGGAATCRTTMGTGWRRTAMAHSGHPRETSLRTSTRSC